MILLVVTILVTVTLTGLRSTWNINRSHLWICLDIWRLSDGGTVLTPGHTIPHIAGGQHKRQEEILSVSGSLCSAMPSALTEASCVDRMSPPSLKLLPVGFCSQQWGVCHTYAFRSLATLTSSCQSVTQHDGGFSLSI